jgi:hypothetical protein
VRRGVREENQKNQSSRTKRVLFQFEIKIREYHVRTDGIKIEKEQNCCFNWLKYTTSIRFLFESIFHQKKNAENVFSIS